MRGFESPAGSRRNNGCRVPVLAGRTPPLTPGGRGALGATQDQFSRQPFPGRLVVLPRGSGKERAFRGPAASGPGRESRAPRAAASTFLTTWGLEGRRKMLGICIKLRIILGSILVTRVRIRLTGYGEDSKKEIALFLNQSLTLCTFDGNAVGTR